jgi:hypothetical protein
VSWELELEGCRPNKSLFWYTKAVFRRSRQLLRYVKRRNLTETNRVRVRNLITGEVKELL